MNRHERMQSLCSARKAATNGACEEECMGIGWCSHCLSEGKEEVMATDIQAKATLERIPISKIRTNKLNSREDFGDLKAFAAEFDDNPVFPGEPWTPLMVYRDANVYRIVDGERRYRAMKEAKKVKECNSYVFETMEDAVAALVMLDTNSKQLLSDEEYSAGLQTALILGVPEKKVDARAGSKCAAALKRQIKRQGGKAAQMSIEQMLAADEFADDPEAYEKIVKADGNSWLYERNRLRRVRDAEKNRIEAEAAVSEAETATGLKVVDKPPRGAILERTLYGAIANEIKKSAAEWAKVGFILARPRENNWGSMTNWEVYSLPPERTPEEEAAAKSKNALRRQAQAGRKRRLEWIAERLLTVGAQNGLHEIRRFVRDYILNNQMYEVEEFCKKADMDSDFFNDSGAYRIANEYVIARYWEYMDHLTNAAVDAIGNGTAKDSAMFKHDAERHVKLVNAMRKDGYEPSDEEAAFVNLCIKVSVGKEKSDDD